MAKNVFKMIKPSPTLGRNAFDLSHREIFTANVGELLPCCCLETIPNDKFEIRPADLVRAAPMVTSPFLRCKQHIDFWFVPYNMLWHKFNNFISSRDEYESSAFKNHFNCPYIDLRQIASAIWNTRLTQYTDVVGMPRWKGACRLLDLLGYDVSALYYAIDQGQSTFDPMTDIPSVKVNLWRLAAYNLIWYREYRQNMYDDGTFGLVNITPAHLFNFDALQCDTLAHADLITQYPWSSGYSISGMLQMRYRPWKKDIFTGLLPSTQFGNVSTVAASLLNPVQIVNSVSFSSGDTTGISSGNNLIKQNNGVGVSGSSQWKIVDGTNNLITAQSSLDILSLRRSEAVQKWRENTLRAGNEVLDNFEAHYGSKPASHVQTHPTFIGSYDSPLNISDVNATAQTGAAMNGDVGSVVGKGISTISDKTFKFETNDFGVIIGLFSLVPEAEYSSTGIDRPNQLLEQFDYYFNEFENLGLEAVSSATYYVGDTSVTKRAVGGYLPRYFAYKGKMDKVHLGFHPNQRYRAWVSPKADLEQAMLSQTPIPLSTLYINPSLLNTIFVSSVQNEEQFIVDLENQVTAIRSLSVSGMPSY